MKKNKGFTMIELLTVIVLLSVIATITYVSIGSGMSSSKEKLYREQIKTLENAGRNWIVKNTGLVDSAVNTNGTSCISNITCFTSRGKSYYKLTFTELYTSGYVKSADVKNPETGEDMTGCIGIYYDNSNNQYIVEYVANCDNN